MPKGKQKRVAKKKCKQCTRTDITGYGLCDAHYQRTYRLVELGRTTWEAEIEAGRAVPSKSYLLQQANKAS